MELRTPSAKAGSNPWGRVRRSGLLRLALLAALLLSLYLYWLRGRLMAAQTLGRGKDDTLRSSNYAHLGTSETTFDHVNYINDFREKLNFRTAANARRTTTAGREGDSKRHAQRELDRIVSARFNEHSITDEVLYSIQSRQDSPSCNAQMFQELVASVVSLRNLCVRCDFVISVVVDDPIYSFLVGNETRSLQLFDRIQRVPIQTQSHVFAARKSHDLLNHASKPYVVFIDSDMFAQHRAVPESIFDLLHKDQDVVMPIDWAHRHGELFGRGVPGLCTCLIAYVNTPAVKQIFQLWKEYIHRIGSVLQSRSLTDAMKDETTDKDVKRWLNLLEPYDLHVYQVRDQEVFSLVLFDNALPQIRLLPLSLEWVCPTLSRGSYWSEGYRSQNAPYQHLVENPCKINHYHGIPKGVVDESSEIAKWMRSVRAIGTGPDKVDKCGGALRWSKFEEMRHITK